MSKRQSNNRWVRDSSTLRHTRLEAPWALADASSAQLPIIDALNAHLTLPVVGALCPALCSSVRISFSASSKPPSSSCTSPTPVMRTSCCSSYDPSTCLLPSTATLAALSRDEPPFLRSSPNMLFPL